MTRKGLHSFEAHFLALTGYCPMRWQRRLFERLVANEVPEVCDIPTGLGKTSILPIWLLAIVRQAAAGNLSLPRRLVYIVNRRTVVDQATEIVERMRARLTEPENRAWEMHAESLRQIAVALDGLGASGSPHLAVSTLRGELADNEEWKADPVRPGIVIGTIDMVGSKLLFSGYGDGRYNRAHHAGLIGQDVLIVHDEAHLSPAFGTLLRSVADMQRQEARRASDRSVIRPIRVLELTATAREKSGVRLTLEDEDQRDEVVRTRLEAKKLLFLHPAGPDGVIPKMAEYARQHADNQVKVLVYVRSPEDAQKLAATVQQQLGASGRKRTALLTGTIRGYERDQLTRRPAESSAATENFAPRVMAHFLSGTQPEETVYLICTSAGEVGIDLDADHMVCDLTTLESLVQRLGRVNRRGGAGREARIDVVGDAPNGRRLSDLDRAVFATRKILERWTQQDGQGEGAGLDVSPGHLRELLGSLDAREREAAFSPTAQAPPLTDILLDGWALTSVQQMAGVPEVSAFLHGVTREVPETFVAWRREVRLLAEAGVTSAALEDWFRACRIESRERLRGRTDRVRMALAALWRQLQKNENGSNPDAYPVVVLDARGRAELTTLPGIVPKENEKQLRYRTIVLPVEMGGLDEQGMLDPKAVHPPKGATLDVAEVGMCDRERQRWICRSTVDSVRYERLQNGESSDVPPAGLLEKVRIRLAEAEEGEDAGEAVELVLFVSPLRSALEDPETASANQTLEEHSRAAAQQMATIAEKLRLPGEIKEALSLAAQWHDKGKDRPVWQWYAHNENGVVPVAKSARYRHPWVLGGFRHEFASVLDAAKDPAIQCHPERDLVLHLIAAHHGWARPHFEQRSFDHTRTGAENEQAYVVAMRRYGQLQQRFGRWGLAWLESLLRCADIAASKAAADRGAPVREGQEALP